MSAPKAIYSISAEPSGDALNVGLLRELRARDPSLTLHAIGGSAVQAEGYVSAIDTGPLSVLGFVEGLRALPAVRKLVLLAARDIMAKAPDAVILIDSWGFSIRLAKWLRSVGYAGRIVKYVAPQVWAMRRGRAGVLARHVDHLLALYPFDVPFFEAEDLPTTCVGNPVLDVEWSTGDGSAFRRRYRIGADDPVVFTAFGSRQSEVERLFDPFIATLRRLQSAHPNLSAVVPLVAHTGAQVRARLATADTAGLNIIVSEDEKRDALAASNVALLKSGTITTQAADAGVPGIVAYAVSPLTYWPARFLMKADYITIVNVCARAPLMPEYIQGDIDPEAMAAQLSHWLTHPEEAWKRGEALHAVTRQMRGQGGANARAAEAVLSMVHGDVT